MLADILPTIRRARDTSSLFTELGYQADSLELDEGVLLVARWKGFRVLAVDSKSAPDGARWLANRMGLLADRGLAVSVGPSEAMALAAPRLRSRGSTRALNVALGNPTPLSIRLLERLRAGRKGNALSHALRVAELLSSEAVSNRFFTAFRLALERMAGSVAPGPGRDDANRKLVVLLALSRVLFLYFVQEKGWLDGRRDYLRSLLDDALARRRHFHRTVLHPLFFGTLNRAADTRSTGRRLGLIPYLNGGLFEPHPVERRFGPIVFSNELWRDAFDGVFERFHFCVREADQVDAIAPDMLGRVFERVMEAPERRDTGTYYTPESLVGQIVDAAIETALVGRHRLSPTLAKSVAGAKSRDRTAGARAHRALRDLRLLDPAVGSGAFLLGALESLTRMRLALSPRPGGAAARWQIRREILRENLVGVDLSPHRRSPGGAPPVARRRGRRPNHRHQKGFTAPQSRRRRAAGGLAPRSDRCRARVSFGR